MRTNPANRPPQLAPQQEQQRFNDDEISLADLFGKLISGKWYVLMGYALVLTAVAAYTYRQDPVYEASSLILINNESSTPQLGDLMGLQMANKNVANEIEIIKSRTIALRVADALMDWKTIPGTNTALSVLHVEPGQPGLTQLDVAQRIQKDYVSVRPVNPDVDLIEIKAKSIVPREAALISDMYADEFYSYNQSQSRRRASAGREFLEEQTQRFDTLVVSAENNMLSYAEAQGVVNPDFEAEALLDQVMELEAERYKTEFLLRAAQSELQTVESELDRIMPGLSRTLSSNEDEQMVAIKTMITRFQLENAETLSKNPDLRQNPNIDKAYAANIQKIEDFTKDLSELSAAYTNDLRNSGTVVLGNNPESAFERIALMQDQIIEKRIELTGAQARIDVLDKELARYQSQIDKIPNKAVLLSRYQRDMETSAQLYTTVFQSLQEARIAEASELGYVDIVDQAVVPNKPISPTIPLNLLLGAVIGLMLGVTAAFVSSALDNKVSRPEDLRQRGYPVLGMIPNMEQVVENDFGGSKFVDIGNKTVSTSLITLLNPLSQISESYRRLRTNVDFSAPDSTRKVVLVTSAEPGEGKTSTSLNLAIANAQLGRKTLFMDADMRRPTSHRLLGLSREPGLVDWLFDESVRDFDGLATHVEDLYFMPVGKAAPNPSELLGSKRMMELLDRLKMKFDTIIIDTPPLLSVSDSLLIASSADMIIQVISSGETHWAALERAQEVLRDAGIVSTGFILNRFDAKKAYGGYGYGYGYGYSYGYGYGYGTDSGLYADREMQQIVNSGGRV